MLVLVVIVNDDRGSRREEERKCVSLSQSNWNFVPYLSWKKMFEKKLIERMSVFSSTRLNTSFQDSY